MHVYPPWEEKAAQYVKEARNTDFEENGIPEVEQIDFLLKAYDEHSEYVFAD